jgi:hypothetical protein
MISEIGSDLLNRVRSVPSLASSTSFAIGGKANDPALKIMVPPLCRLLLMNLYADEDPRSTGSARGGGIVPATQMMLLDFRALIIVPYLDDNDILNVEFPLLEAVAKTVKATTAATPSNHRWRFLGQKLSFVYPDRLGFEQRYTIDAAL